MNRKRTKLEEALISRGYRLSSKEYKGKRSDRTECYVYSKTYSHNQLGEWGAEVKLDIKRSSIKDCVLVNAPQEELTHEAIYLLVKRHKVVEGELAECLADMESDL